MRDNCNECCVAFVGVPGCCVHRATPPEMSSEMLCDLIGGPTWPFFYSRIL